MGTTRFDAIIIGTGQAGPALAARLSAAGQAVAVIERDRFGGTCVNNGCTPTKAMVASAYAAHLARRAGDYGVAIASPVSVDMKRVKARKDEIVQRSSQGVEGWMRGLDNGTVYRGHARFAGPRSVQVNSDTLEADRVFINVGGRPLVPSMPGLDRVPFLTNLDMMELDEVPERLLVVGGSYIGLEFGQMFRRFGSEVTIVEMGPRLIRHEDPDVSQAVHDILAGEGIDIRLNATCLALEPDGAGVAVTVDCGQGPPRVSGSHLLLAVGRVPNTDDLGLDAAGIATDERGYILVDDELRTSVDGVFALGDCNGRGAFTHTSWNDHEIVADNILHNAGRKVSDRITRFHEGGGRRRQSPDPRRRNPGRRRRRDRAFAARRHVCRRAVRIGPARHAHPPDRERADPHRARRAAAGGLIGWTAARQRIMRFSTRSVTTAGSARVDVSPSWSASLAAILRRMRRMILPERVLGRPGAHWM
jgi:pyruvate/2-oxoglutarate dehydrogenase complex dihydrolipoamide dehydrogenase (E3) component